ncbi:exo-alpha-sialidase [Budviciaceae bacterium BWR-B9]|uniref:Exo-alpha-sialidase n=1 Tax=Limnobaculum allomyrinae TaxID=2791986 RepID=A0ABS1IPI4_9GAMM|nr:MULTISPECIES: exo-alpha-sialidase [Limnobaculum]MBK5143669.1 exo-alpha-sialidase [Limnobaculum allomyrinae]MBV7692685.1 exo-alpha-sialidase [Limnobaculum sp. M2-1]
MHFIKQSSQFLLDVNHQLFNNCHASTLVVLPDSDQLLVAYFAGQKEASGDTAIWLSRCVRGEWQPAQRAIAQDGLAHWNPVLHYQCGTLWLFYKVGPDVHHWITRYVTSGDGGYSWSQPQELVPGDPLPRGPVKNKLLVMSNGEWLAPSSIENDRYWDAFVDISADLGECWQRVDIPIAHIHPVSANERDIWQGLKDDALWETDLQRVFEWDGVIQPTLWESAPGLVHAMMRSSRGRIYRSDSMDYGRSWCPAYETELPNNNSGIDVVRLGNGSLVLAYNPIEGNWNRRYPISINVSQDNGKTWSIPLDLENGEGEFSYPAIIANGETLHVTYTWNRKNIVYQKITSDNDNNGVPS